MLDTQAADRLSDAIVEVVNAELRAMQRSGGIHGPTLLAGQLLALMATLNTAPRPRPDSINRLEDAVITTLDDIMTFTQ